MKYFRQQDIRIITAFRETKKKAIVANSHDWILITYAGGKNTNKPIEIIIHITCVIHMSNVKYMS